MKAPSHLGSPGWWILLSILCPAMQGAEFFTAPGGNDGNPGTLDRPFATIQHGIEQLHAGDTLYLRSGRYREQVVANGLRGAELAPICLRNYPEETAIIDGTEPMGVLAEASWIRQTGAIYSIKLNQECWQLFLDGQPAQPARFPNASLLDGRIWDMRASMLKPNEVTSTNLTCPDLAASGRDFTGAVAVLAVGHWLTYARPVLAHGKGASEIHYDSSLPNVRGQEVKIKPNTFFYLLGKACLDCENEWWFDSQTRTAWFWAPGGKNPAEAGSVSARVRDYGLVIQGSQHLQISGLEFFACAPFMDQAEGIRFEECRFRYPSENKFMLGRFGWFSPAESGPDNPGNNMFVLRSGRHCALTNCLVEFCNSSVGLLAEGIQVENCLFHDIEWDVNSNGGSGSVWIGPGAKAIRNTIHTCGSSEGLRPVGPGAEIAWNHLYRMGLLQIDGAAINCGMQAHRGLAVHHNWVHDCKREAIRFDYPDVNSLHPEGQAGTFCFNVMWNCQLPMVKGDLNLVHNNISFRHHKHGEFGGGSLDGVRDLVILGFRKIHRNVVFNERTLACNNIARLGHFLAGDRLPCREDHNLKIPKAAEKTLQDPLNWDFRPKRDSEVVDAGRVIQSQDKPHPDTPLVSAEYLGRAPDIGAYEHGATSYWIPGRQYPHATTPIPPDGATNVRPDADLMFLGGYKADSHIVFVGESREAMKKQAELRDTNVLTPVGLKPGRTCYWRVDAVREGKTTSGPVWKFTVGTQSQNKVGR
ncbi:MAG: hypothetical protein JSW66_08270 [Phycisphaerales bacterium]|nr:MAG: hypothetical protein JSW66_08270 [Phycisphaerales bacterium]